MIFTLFTYNCQYHYAKTDRKPIKGKTNMSKVLGHHELPEQRVSASDSEVSGF